MPDHPIHSANATWTSRAGPWLAIGTSPVGLTLGAALTPVSGTISIVTLVLGAALMAGALWVPARMGVPSTSLRGGTLTELTRDHLSPAGARAVAGLLGIALAGWFSVNAALGGAGLADTLDVPVTPVVMAVSTVELLLVHQGLASWNRLAVAATLASLALVVTTGAHAGDLPIGWDVPTLGSLAVDLVAFLGYVAAFSVRSPDFTYGLRRQLDVLANITLLVTATIATVVVGAGISGIGDDGRGDLVTALAVDGRVPGGGTFLLLATVAPALVAGHSWRLSLRALGMPDRLAPLAALAATALAVSRPDRALVSWLTALGSALPAVVIPLWLGRRRSAGSGTGQQVPAWTWLPGVAAGSALGLGAPAAGLLASVMVTGLLATVWSRTQRTRDSES